LSCPRPRAPSAAANAVYDTTIGWRFINKLMKEKYGVDSMPETAENVATDFNIEREAQDRMALAQPDEGGGCAKSRLLRCRNLPGHHSPERKGDAGGGEPQTSTHAKPAWRRLAKLRAGGARQTAR
jgi:hypothetical protein